MLNFFRRRDTAVRFVLGGMLVLICVAMVMFLIPGFGNGASSSPEIADQNVATVDGVAISQQQLGSELQRMTQGQQIPASILATFGQQVLRNLVVEQALADQARKIGLVATDQEVIEAAREQDAQLYPNGVYVGDDAAGQQIGNATGMTLAGFQERLREDVLASKLYDLVTDPVRVTDADLSRQFQRDNDKVKFDYVYLKPADFEAEVNPTDAQLQTWYQANLKKYQTPPRRKIEVLLANTAQISAAIDVTDQQVESAYRANIGTYSQPERVKAAHILFKTSGQTPAQVAATKAKAEDVLKQIRAGADFAAMAKKYSQDDATAPNGGELGWIQRGQMVANFEKTSFTLPPGQISDVIQTEYGFHIVKVEAHDQARLQPLSEVKDQIVQQLQAQRGQQKAQDLINQAASQLATRTPIEQVAAKLGLQSFSPPPIAQTDPVVGIGVNVDFATAVFTAAVGGVTAPVQVAQGYAVAKVDQIIPPANQPLDAVRDQVLADYKQQQELQLVKSKAQELAQAAQKDGLKNAAAALHDKLETSDLVQRAGSLKDAGPISSFADSLFALKPGQTGPATALGDNQIVYSLDQLQQPTPADFAAQAGSVMQTLVTQRRQAVFQAYEDALIKSLVQNGNLKYNAVAFNTVINPDGQSQPDSGGASPFGN